MAAAASPPAAGFARLTASLHLRLSLVLLLLFVLLAVSTLAVFRHFSRNYQEEVKQRLNRDVAMYIAQEHRAIGSAVLDANSLADLFRYAMILNPVADLYVLDAQGQVVERGPATRERPSQLAVSRVPLEPLRAFLSDAPLPIFAVDPASGALCVFSVAPIGDARQPVGYVYAVLGSSASEAAAMAAGGSYGLTLAAASILASVAFLAATGLLLFRSLTGRLQRLADRVDRFAVRGAPEPAPAASAAGADEIARLTGAFDAMAARIEAQVAQLEAIDRGRREAVANASHDLRTPLAALQGYLQTLQLKNDVLSAEQKAGYLQTAQRHAERLRVLVEQMFALAKLDAPEAAPNRERFSAAELAGDIVQKFQLRAQQSGIALRAEIDADAPALFADIGLIERLLENLVDNALKFTPVGGAVCVQVRTSAAPDAALEIAVTDTGRGIAAADLPHVFDRFYRANRGDGESRSAAESGSGLGLAIVRRIAELHGARLDVQSTPGAGSRFSVRFDPGSS
jgi:signal transduction histidine kinase